MRKYWWLAVGLLLIAGGVVTAVRARAWVLDGFGWFGYTPLDDPDLAYLQSFPARVQQMWIGLAVTVVGLVLIVAGGGYQVGWRRWSRMVTPDDRARSLDIYRVVVRTVMPPSSRAVASAISPTAVSKASWLAADGARMPATFRTY